MTSTTDATDRVREIVRGNPNDPPPPKRDGWTPPSPPRLPVVDRARIVDEVVTRRLVVVDSQNRERLVIEERPTDDMMRIEVASADYASSFSIDVGIERTAGEPYALIVANARGHSVVIHVDADDSSVEVENAGLGIPTAKLTNEVLEFKTIH
jgi:hypothetical protein